MRLQVQHHYGDDQSGRSTPFWTMEPNHQLGEQGDMFVNRLRELRNLRGLSEAELAKLAKTSSQQIDRLEKGQRTLSLNWAERLAPHLGVQPIELVYDGALPQTPSKMWLPKPETLADLLATAMHVDDEDHDRRDEIQIYANAVHTGLEWIADEHASEGDQSYLKAVRRKVLEVVAGSKSGPSKAA